jgi:hypothetical protein
LIFFYSNIIILDCFKVAEKNARMTTLTKQRRGSLNNIINREIRRREMAEIDRLEIEQGKRTVLLEINPVYSEWTEDKERGQWYPLNFDKNIGNPGFDDEVFATQFVDVMDALYSKMRTYTRITSQEYEETYPRVFAASHNIGRFYIEWEESKFGVTPLVKKWKNI